MSEKIDPSKLKVTELKEELKSRGYDTKGTKAILTQRLTEALANETSEAPANEKQDSEGKKGKKRTASKKGKEEEEEKPAKKGKTEETPSKKVFKAKVDKLCPRSTAEVYSSNTHTYDVMLNQTNIGNNNNKYYVIQLLKEGGRYAVWTRWGRVGESGQNALLNCGSLDDAIRTFNKKFKDKTGNTFGDSTFVPKSGKYTVLEMSHSDDEGEEEVINQALSKANEGPKVKPCTLPKPTQELVKLIFDNDMFKQALKTFNIDTKKMPLGKISKSGLQKGFEVLEEIEKVLKAGKKTGLSDLTNKFYTLIPHDFGRQRPPVIDDLELLQQKMDLLEVLGDIEIAQNLLNQGEGKQTQKEVPHPLDVNYRKLNNIIEPVDKDSEEFKIIETYTTNTMGYRKVKIKHAFRVDRKGELERFSKYKNIQNRKLLWHGTNVAVVVAILSSGLRIMPHSGGRVGRGIYFASENAKSAGYVGLAGKTGIMFLNEVALGKEHIITRDDPSLRAAPKGYDCVIAKGRVEPDPSKNTVIQGKFGDIVVPQGKPIDMPESKGSSFFNSEYLVYDEAQNYMRYLLMLDFSS